LSSLGSLHVEENLVLESHVGLEALTASVASGSYKVLR
jgi:hypothetical protein